MATRAHRLLFRVPRVLAAAATVIVASALCLYGRVGLVIFAEVVLASLLLLPPGDSRTTRWRALNFLVACVATVFITGFAVVVASAPLCTGWSETDMQVEACRVPGIEGLANFAMGLLFISTFGGCMMIPYALAATISVSCAVFWWRLPGDPQHPSQRFPRIARVGLLLAGLSIVGGLYGLLFGEQGILRALS